MSSGQTISAPIRKNTRTILLTGMVGFVVAGLFVALTGRTHNADGNKRQAVCQSTNQFASDVNANLVDRSLATDASCGAGCWHGLNPGLSTSAEAISVLKEASFVDQATITTQKDIYDRSGNVIITWNSAASARNVRIGVISIDNGDRVRYIRLFLEYPLSLNDLTERIGNPDAYSIHPMWIDMPTGCYEVTFFWFEQGLLATTTELSSQQSVSANDTVSEVMYFAPVTNGSEYLREIGSPSLSETMFHRWTSFAAIVLP